MKEKNTSWGKVAKWYDATLEKNHDTYQAKVILPNLLRLLNPKKGDIFLDVACGQGYFSKVFYKSGAKVIGTDIAPELIKIAQQTKDRIDFYVAPADKMPMIKDKSVDTAVIVLALQNIENLQGTIAECARVLKPQGRLALVLNHPAFRIAGASSWGWDEATSQQYRRVDNYLSESRSKIQMHPGENPSEFTISFHRPLQVYVKALRKYGFAVTQLEEWNSHKKSQTGPRAKEEDRTRKEIPLFLYVEAQLLS